MTYRSTVEIIIYSDNADTAQKIAALLEKNSIGSRIIDDKTKLDRLLAADPPVTLFYAEKPAETAAETAQHSILVYVEDNFSKDSLLTALRIGAFDYYSLDGGSGRIEDVLSRIERFELNDISSAGLIRYLLESNEQHFRTVAENAFYSEFWLDASDNLVFQSPSIEKMTGFPLNAFYDDSPDFFRRMIYPLDLEGFELQAVSFKRDINHPPLVRTYRIVTKTGELRWWETCVEHIFDRNGTYIGKRGTSRDITEQVHAEEETAKIISEKDLLVKEVHHRVKNNLAIISGIINLQELYLHDERDYYILNILKNRIESMISVHELLYSGKSSKSFSLEELARIICMNLIQKKPDDTSKIKLIYNIDPTPIDSDYASPIGLILNELVTNSIKHAFTDRNAGRIVIGSRNILDKKIRVLTVADDGCGFPDGITEESGHSLGLILVKSLTGQLGGEIVFTNNEGAHVEISFPYPEINIAH